MNEVVVISVSLACGPYSFASTWNATVGDQPSMGLPIDQQHLDKKIINVKRILHMELGRILKKSLELSREVAFKR